MGNHDNRENFWKILQADKTVRPGLPGRQAAIVRTEEANWFLLDSLIQTRITPGLLGEAQRAWLAGALDANADKPALIMIHHQPGPISRRHKEQAAWKMPPNCLRFCGRAGRSKLISSATLIAGKSARMRAAFIWLICRRSLICLTKDRPTAGFTRRCRTTARGWNCVAWITRTKDHGQVVNLAWRNS